MYTDKFKLLRRTKKVERDSEMKMKHINKLISLILCFAILPMCFFAANAETDGVLYTDVPENAWYTEAVYDVTANGLMNGFGNGEFRPEERLSRAMTASLIWRLAGSPAVDIETIDETIDENDRFIDIMYPFQAEYRGIPLAWYFEAVAWCRNENIMVGYSRPPHYLPNGDIMDEYNRNEFRPDAAITREELAAVIYRFADDRLEHYQGLTLFPDHDEVSDWAHDALAWCTVRRIIMGTGENGDIYLNPKGEVTRAEAAMIFMRLSRWMEQQQKPE